MPRLVRVYKGRTNGGFRLCGPGMGSGRAGDASGISSWGLSDTVSGTDTGTGPEDFGRRSRCATPSMLFFQHMEPTRVNDWFFPEPWDAVEYTAEYYLDSVSDCLQYHADQFFLSSNMSHPTIEWGSIV